MRADCAIAECSLTIADLPDLLPAVLEPTYDLLLPDLLGGDVIVLPEQMPTGLPEAAVRDLAAALTPGRAPRTVRATPGPPSGPAGSGSVVIDGAACARLLAFLAQVSDRRAGRGRRYPLPYLLALPIVAMLAHHVDITGIAEWIADAPADLLLALGAPTGPTGHPRRPGAKTITDVLTAHGEDYDRALCAFTGSLTRDQHQHAHRRLHRSLHVDGKALHGATSRGGRTPMLLSARFDDGTVAAQHTVPVEKTNEITVFAPLLDQISDTDMTGTVVTADQLHTQRGHANYLHRRGGFYVFTLGGNQPRLFAAADALPWAQIAVEHATIARGHGRIEIRTIRTLPATDTITALFPHVTQAFLLERYIYATDGKPLGAVAVLGVTNLTAEQADGADLLAHVRGHWSIESLHWLRSPGVLPPAVGRCIDGWWSGFCGGSPRVWCSWLVVVHVFQLRVGLGCERFW